MITLGRATIRERVRTTATQVVPLLEGEYSRESAEGLKNNQRSGEGYIISF